MSAAEKAASPQKRPAPEPAAGAPEAKKAKPDLAAIKKQIEYYFSDGNLQNDAFFHGKISEEKEGWLDFHWIQSCNKIKAMGQPTAVLIEALKDSPLETKTEGEKSFVRRTATLPALSETARTGLLQRGTDNAEKKKLTAHDGGVLIRFTELPEGLNYGPIKEALRSLLPDKGRVLFATNVTEKRSTNILLAPFDDDVELVEKLEVKVKVEDTEHTLRFEICYGDVLREAVKDLPKHIVKRREALAKNRQKQRQKPVHLAGQKFANMQTLRGKVKEIIMSRKDGQELIEGSPDTLLVRAILAHHPRATEKLAGLKGLKVDQSGFETNGKKSRCFHLTSPPAGRSRRTARARTSPW
jgi:hypothetical protein